MGNYKQALYGYNAAHDYENVIRIDLDKLNDPQDAIKVVQEHRSTEGSKMIARYSFTIISMALMYISIRCNKK